MKTLDERTSIQGEIAEVQMRQLILVRHARSQSNDGIATRDPATIGLVPEGWRQAEAFADKWALEAPELVVSSPYVRTQQTAAPILRRLGGLRHEVWPEVREFTYLAQPAVATTPEERAPLVDQYWRQASPQRRDLGAESFADFWKRVAAFGEHAAATNCPLLLVFTHGLFMAAFEHHCSNRQAEANGELMHQVNQLRKTPASNVEAVRYCWTQMGWVRNHDAII